MRLNRTIALMLLFVQMGIMHPYLAYSAGETGGGKASGAGTKPAPPQEIALANSAVAETPQQSNPPKQEIILASATKQISAAEGGTISLEDTEIIIPPGALSADTEVTITRLAATENTGEDIANVTAGGGGWRFEPAGTVFQKETTIKMAYDKSLEGNEAALSNLYTYYYNIKTQEWERLPRKGFEKERSRVISGTTHFTDMINGTLTLPEGPKPLQFNINSIKGLEAANPGSGVPAIKGLEGNNTGAASFQIELDLPPGRAGMQPSVAIGYSSDMGNGTLGKGFSLQAGGEISTDTRWGLPKYEDEHDTYLLNGVKLRRIEGGSGSELLYKAERAASKERIIHYKSGTTDYWEATDTQGVKRTYGRSADTWTGYTEGGETGTRFALSMT